MEHLKNEPLGTGPDFNPFMSRVLLRKWWIISQMFRFPKSKDSDRLFVCGHLDQHHYINCWGNITMTKEQIFLILAGHPKFFSSFVTTDSLSLCCTFFWKIKHVWHISIIYSVCTFILYLHLVFAVVLCSQWLLTCRYRIKVTRFIYH